MFQRSDYKRNARYFLLTQWVLFSLMLPPVANAECDRAIDGSLKCGPGYCMTGKYAFVWCSPYEHGGVAADLNGVIWAGKGKCALDAHGQVKCSPFPEGSVRINPLGDAKAGKGQCQTEQPVYYESRVFCSVLKRGHVRVHIDGTIICEGGCVLGIDAVSAVPAIKGVGDESERITPRIQPFFRRYR